MNPNGCGKWNRNSHFIPIACDMIHVMTFLLILSGLSVSAGFICSTFFRFSFPITLLTMASSSIPCGSNSRRSIADASRSTLPTVSSKIFYIEHSSSSMVCWPGQNQHCGNPNTRPPRACHCGVHGTSGLCAQSWSKRMPWTSKPSVQAIFEMLRREKRRPSSHGHNNI